MGFRQDQVVYIRQRLGAYDELAKTHAGIDTEHFQIHQGRAFSMSHIAESAPGSSYLVQINTGDKYMHLRHRSYSVQRGEWLLTMWEEPTTVTPGAIEVPIFNKDRNSPEISSVEIFGGGSGLIGGTIINQIYMNAGEQQQSVGRELSSTEEEWILRPNSTYIVEWERLAGSGQETITIATRWFWYEIDA